MTSNPFDVIIIGAGPSGLSASYFLNQYGLKHIVFERGKVGESWRSQRWNSFRVNSPNRLNDLPGSDYFKNEPEAFCIASDYVSSFENYVRRFCLPVADNAKVYSIQKLPASEIFRVDVLINSEPHIYHSKNIIIASGCQSEVKIPAYSKNISSSVYQLHAGQYRSAVDLPEGNVLVVGSAQSGCQIADDLADSGRKVYLSTSMAPRVPRKYRGRDIHDWLLDMNFFAAKKEQITDPAILNMKAPQLTGVGMDPKTMSLQSLAKKGVKIIGKLQDANSSHLTFEMNAAQHVKFADMFSMRVKKMIDEFIAKERLNFPEAERDEEDFPDENTGCVDELNSLDLQKENIGSIIWTTGFACDLNYLKLPILDTEGNPKQKDGIGEIPGTYFLGFHWLRNRKSVLICGIKEDAVFIAQKVYENCSVQNDRVHKQASTRT